MRIIDQGDAYQLVDKESRCSHEIKQEQVQNVHLVSNYWQYSPLRKKWKERVGLKMSAVIAVRVFSAVVVVVVVVFVGGLVEHVMVGDVVVVLLYLPMQCY